MLINKIEKFKRRKLIRKELGILEMEIKRTIEHNRSCEREDYKKIARLLRLQTDLTFEYVNTK